MSSCRAVGFGEAVTVARAGLGCLGGRVHIVAGLGRPALGGLRRRRASARPRWRRRVRSCRGRGPQLREPGQVLRAPEESRNTTRGDGSRRSLARTSRGVGIAARNGGGSRRRRRRHGRALGDRGRASSALGRGPGARGLAHRRSKDMNEKVDERPGHLVTPGADKVPEPPLPAAGQTLRSRLRRVCRRSPRAWDSRAVLLGLRLQ